MILRTSDFFVFFEQLPPEMQQAFFDLFQPMEVEPGFTLTIQGDPSDSAYVVEHGMFEVLAESPDGREQRLLAYINRGDITGEIGVLTGLPRMATVRSIEKARILKLTARDFIRVLQEIPGFGAYIAINVAERLHRTALRAYQTNFGVDLGGNLSNFDLIVLFQTINSGSRTGELRLYTPNGQVVGNFFFRHDRIDYAQYGHLTGIEAIWQALGETNVLGSFQFQICDHPTEPVDVDRKIAKPCGDLLLESASRRDELMALPPELRNLEMRVERASSEWIDASYTNPGVAREIWESTEKLPQPKLLLWRKLNESVLSLLRHIRQLEAAGLVRVIPSNPET